MKKRLIAGGLALLLFLWLSLAISSNFGLLLARQMKRCSLRTFKMLAVLAADPRSVKLFLLLAVGSVLLVLWMLFGNSYLNYKSDMYEVVPGFSIPRPAGQGQHGTAWFMPQKKFADAFASAEVEETLPLPPELTERYQKERRDIHAADDKAG
ncbi:hypothetical protein [Oscillibacter sp.]|uniref:hypothetical protein n=1 Tax=Oscillibacter sp. TaxID=1945593 RepID=UPI003394967D